MFFRKHFYIVTMAEDGLGLDLYYLGKMTKKEAAKQVVEINNTFPFLFLVLSGWNLRHQASNKVKLSIADVRGIDMDTVGAACKDEALRIAGKTKVLN